MGVLPAVAHGLHSRLRTRRSASRSGQKGAFSTGSTDAGVNATGGAGASSR